MSKRNPSTTPAVLLAVAVSGFAALAFYVTRSGTSQLPADMKKPEVKIATPVDAGGQAKLDWDTERVPAGQDPIVYAMNGFLTGSKILPEGTRVLAAKVEGGLCTLDFNPAFTAEGVGSDDEQTLLDGILKTLRQFPEIERVQFRVEGKPIDAIGNVELSEPLPVKEGVSPQAGDAPPPTTP